MLPTQIFQKELARVRSFAVVHLATSAAGMQDVVATVASVPLSEDDDPALLTGPDRVEQSRVLAYQAPRHDETLPRSTPQAV